MNIEDRVAPDYEQRTVILSFHHDFVELGTNFADMIDVAYNEYMANVKEWNARPAEEKYRDYDRNPDMLPWQASNGVLVQVLVPAVHVLPAYNLEKRRKATPLVPRTKSG